jgi:predicted TIM-barrel fold metal-dependent hydrolase
MATNSLVPKGSWDTHIHVFNPDNFPYSPKRSYTPKSAQITEYPAETTGCKNIVLVHASIQGSSPAPLLDTLSKEKQLHGYTLRGLASIDVESVKDEELDALHAAGVRGARLHRVSWGHGHQSAADELIEELAPLVQRLARLHWVIDIFCDVGTWAGMAPFIRNSDPNIKWVADHFGGTFPGQEKSTEFKIFLELVAEKRVSVKLSGFERLYHGHDEGIDALALPAKAIIDSGPDMIVYGSDWPHTQLGVSRMGKSQQQRLEEVEGFRKVSDLAHIRKLREWIPDEQTWHKLWVKNPQRLFA